MVVHGAHAMAATIPNSAHVIADHGLVCRVCEKQYSKYTCPQCNVRYCSLACYKNHSVRCTESFARNNVIEEMSVMKVSKESQQHMLEALKRVRLDDDGRSILDDETFGDEGMGDDDLDDAQGTIFSERTLRLIAEGGDISLDQLSVEERKAFLQALAGGKISHLIQPWNPWWLNPRAGTVSIAKHGTSLIQPADPSEGQNNAKLLKPEASDATTFSDVPAPPSEGLAQIRQLIRTDPSPSISVQLAEVIYSYCFTLRFCNGDWQSEPLDAALILLAGSLVLDQAASPESIPIALRDAVQTVCSPIFKQAGGLKFAIALCDDCSAVLRLGRACVVCALADMHRMLETAKKELKAELGVAKQAKHELKAKSGGLNDKISSSTAKDEENSGSSAINNPSSTVAREEGSVGVTYADMRKRRDSKRALHGNKKPLSTENGTSNTSSNASQRGLQGNEKPVSIENGKPNTCSSSTVSRSPNQTNAAKHKPVRQSKTNVELKTMTTAIRKIYFLMCWTNEQASEAFSSLALLVDAEKDRLLEIDVTKNTGLGMVHEVKAPVSKSRPIIEEIVEKRA